MRSSLLCAAALLVLSAACDSVNSATDKAKEAKAKAVDAADATKKTAQDAAKMTNDAVDASKNAIDASKNAIAAGSEQAKATADKANALWNNIPKSGELSTTAEQWLSDAASETSVEGMIATGRQIAPAAAEIRSTLGEVLDSDTVIEPIFQKVDATDAATVDKAIADMPRTEVIEGLTVGFKRLDETSNAGMVTERGYLVTWREGDRLIGFVYRTKRTIDVDKLVAETPRLIALTKTVIASL